MSTSVRAQVTPLIHEGLSDRAIARRVRCSRNTVANIRTSLGIRPAHKGTPQGSPSLAEAFAARTKPAGAGHLKWTGSVEANGRARLYIKGRCYSARAAALTIRTGRKPFGNVVPVCGHDWCVAPSHLVDSLEPWSPTVPAGWQRNGACLRHDPEDFDPAPPVPDRVAAAKAVCDRCPVLAICRETALQEEGGMAARWRATIRGGLTPEERYRIYLDRQQEVMA